MSLVMRMNISNMIQYKNQLIKYGEELGYELEKALNDEAQVIATVAKELVPVDLGNLRASITVDPEVGAYYEEGELFVEIVAGDVAVQYAQIQEEREDFQHTVGQAHYMRDAAERSLIGIEQRLIEKLSGVKE